MLTRPSTGSTRAGFVSTVTLLAALFSSPGNALSSPSRERIGRGWTGVLEAGHHFSLQQISREECW